MANTAFLTIGSESFWDGYGRAVQELRVAANDRPPSPFAAWNQVRAQNELLEKDSNS